MKNNRLDSILIIKTNLPVLRTTIANCEDTIVNAAIQKYYERKQWRWQPRPSNENVENSQAYMKGAFGSPPPKRHRLQDNNESTNNTSSEDDDSSSDESTIDENISS